MYMYLVNESKLNLNKLNRQHRQDKKYSNITSFYCRVANGENAWYGSEKRGHQH